MANLRRDFRTFKYHSQIIITSGKLNDYSKLQFMGRVVFLYKS